jgi:leader peptidase (prepilin peptidase) / N-methyltransferase
MSPGLQLYIDFCVFLFGAAIGSFLNVCIYRMPLGKSIVSPPSSCPSCGQRIAWFDNIPLVSYLTLGGRCRHCHAQFTSRYFLVELLTALMFLTIWVTFTGWLAPIYWLFVVGLIVATFIDFEHFIIPNEITYGGVVIGFLLSLLYPPLMKAQSIGAAAFQSFLGILVGGLTLFFVVEIGKLFLGKRRVPLPVGTPIIVADQTITFGDEQIPWIDIFYRDSDRIAFQAATLKFGELTFENASVLISETKLTVNGQEHELTGVGRVEATTDLVIIPREAMGLGDVKLLAAIGAFLGWKAALFTVFLSSLVGGVVGLTLIVTGKTDWQSRIPYGPYIVAGALTWLFFGQSILHWYMSLARG